MFKITVTAKVQKLLDYYNRVNQNQWLLLGNTSPWNNDTIAPEPSFDIATILEPIKFFKVTSYTPVYISSDGDIQLSSVKYQTVNSFNKNTLIDLKVSSLLITTIISNTDIGNITYRSAGLCNNLSVSSSNSYITYNSNITYDLEGVAYFTPRSTSNTLQSNVFRFVIDF